MRHLKRQATLGQPAVERCRAPVPGGIEVTVDRLHVRRLEMAQEFVHGRHHVGMGVERAAREADVGRAIVAEALHILVRAAHDADRQAAAHRLAVGHEIGLDAEIFLGAAQREAETDEDLVEDQHDAAVAADGAKFLQPCSVGVTVDTGVRPAVDQGRIGGGCLVGIERLRWIDEDAGDVAAPAQHLERGLGHVRQGVSVVRGNGIPHAGLHVAPPAMIGAAKPHEVGTSRVVARQPDGLHDGLGSRHVERDFILAGDARQPRNVVIDQRRVGTQHRPEGIDPPGAAIEAGLVEVVAQQVDAIGAREVVAGVAVEVGDHDAARPGEKRAHRELRPRQGTELEGHAVGFGELQVGDVPARFLRLLQGSLIFCPEEARETLEFGPSPAGDLRRGVVGGEEPRFVEGVVGNQAGDAA